MRQGWLVALATAGLVGCGHNNSTDDNVDAALKNYSNHLYAAYSDSVSDAQALSAKLDAFTADPTEAKLADARTAWLASRQHYMLTEGARFFGGPIDVEPLDHEESINSWPLDEAYIDYTVGSGASVNETVGLINHPDILPDITADAIDALNAKGGDTNISDGYHAIEFLLWGQATADVGPGQRPASDYDPAGPRANVARRIAYLKAAMQGVINHLIAVRDAWAPDADFRKSFEAGGLDSVGLALTGLGKMSKGELAGQRMAAPYASKSRRDQHDCFSSQTLVDYVRDAQGIQDLYLGTYNGDAGPSLSDLVKAKNADVDATLRTQLEASVDGMKSIPAPFEASIVGSDDSPGRTAIRNTINSLRSQGDSFAQAASALGLSIVVPAEN